MKTPRELLLARHQSIAPKLDQIRREVVGQIGGGAPSHSFAQTLWRELFWPVRHLWLGLGAAWVVVLAFNLVTGGETGAKVSAPGPMAADSIMALERRQWLMAEDDMTPLPPARPVELRPRSEAPVEQKIV
jgi:hypothetical protein